MRTRLQNDLGTRRLVWAVAALLGLLVGCGHPGRLLVVVGTDFVVPVPAARLRVTVKHVNADGSEEISPDSPDFELVTSVADAHDGRQATMPLSFVVRPKGGESSRRIELQFELLDANGVLLLPPSVRSVNGFVPNETRVLPVHLSLACRELLCGGDASHRQYCERGMCFSAEAIDPHALPGARDPGHVVELLDAGAFGVPVDGAGVDGGPGDAAIASEASVPDAGPTDAGAALAARWLDGVAVQDVAYGADGLIVAAGIQPDPAVDAGLEARIYSFWERTWSVGPIHGATSSIETLGGIALEPGATTAHVAMLTGKTLPDERARVCSAGATYDEFDGGMPCYETPATTEGRNQLAVANGYVVAGLAAKMGAFGGLDGGFAGLLHMGQPSRGSASSSAIVLRMFGVLDSVPVFTSAMTGADGGIDHDTVFVDEARGVMKVVSGYTEIDGAGRATPHRPSVSPISITDADAGTSPMLDGGTAARLLTVNDAATADGETAWLVGELRGALGACVVADAEPVGFLARISLTDATVTSCVLFRQGRGGTSVIPRFVAAAGTKVLVAGRLVPAMDGTVLAQFDRTNLNVPPTAQWMAEYEAGASYVRDSVRYIVSTVPTYQVSAMAMRPDGAARVLAVTLSGTEETGWVSVTADGRMSPVTSAPMGFTSGTVLIAP